MKMSRAYMTKFILKIVLLTMFALPAKHMYSQEAKATEKAPASSKAKRKKAKEKWKEDRKAEMEHKKMVKEHHKRIQTKETRKRMRAEKKKSEKLRANKRESFIVRWFKYRKK